MYIFVTYNNTSVAVCLRHKGLAEKRGWGLLEWRKPDDEYLADWPCFFETEVMRAA